MHCNLNRMGNRGEKKSFAKCKAYSPLKQLFSDLKSAFYVHTKHKHHFNANIRSQQSHIDT